MATHRQRKKALQLTMNVTASVGRPYSDDDYEQTLVSAISRLSIAGNPKDIAEAQRLERKLDHFNNQMAVKARRQAAEEEKLKARQSLKDYCERLPERYQPTIALLRDHVDGAALRNSSNIGEYVSGGKRELWQPEAFANSAFRGSEAWNRFYTGCYESWEGRDIDRSKPYNINSVEVTFDKSSMAFAVTKQCREMIIKRKSPTRCINSLGLPNNGETAQKIQNTLLNGLEEASVYLGV